jgi:hypothetical protein
MGSFYWSPACVGMTKHPLFRFFSNQAVVGCDHCAPAGGLRTVSAFLGAA